MAYKTQYTQALKKNYFLCSNKITAIGLTPNAVATFCYLLSHHENFMPSLRVMAEALGCGKTAVSNAIKSLLSHNVINVTKKMTGNGDRSFYKNVYSINPDTHWKFKTINKRPTLPQSKTTREKPPGKTNLGIVKNENVIPLTKNNLF